MLAGATTLTPAVAVVAGTAIDIDHFVVARLRTGSWRALRRGFDDPRRFVLAQPESFADGAVGMIHRLSSHAVIGGATVGVLAFLAPAALLVVGLSLYAHVLVDLVVDTALVNRVEKRDTDRPLRELVR